MPPRNNIHDQRRTEIVKHLKILAEQNPDGRIRVQDYLRYRDDYKRKHGAEAARWLISSTTLYRLFGSWEDALEAAGVHQKLPSETSRTPDDVLDQAMIYVANALGTKTLSTRTYDDFRQNHEDLKLPSSSAIRKHRGEWQAAVAHVGLETTSRNVQRKMSEGEMLESLRKAKRAIDGMLTPAAYGDYLSQMSQEEQEKWPTTQQVLKVFPTWDSALTEADIEQSDVLHPRAIWTTEEARAIWRKVSRVLTSNDIAVTQPNYDKIRAQASRPMPSWSVMQDLLHDVDSQVREL